MTCSTPVVQNTYFLQGLMDVNESNFGAGRILQVDINCDHVYVDPATLFASYFVNTFLALTDTPSTYVGSGTYLVRVNAAGTALEFINPASIAGLLGDKLVASQAGQAAGYLGTVLTVNTTYLTKTISGPNVHLTLNPTRLSSIVNTFLGLTDTPSTYSGQAGKYVRVNSGGTALEFATAIGSGRYAKQWLLNDFVVTQPVNDPDAFFSVDTMTQNETAPGSAAMISTRGGFPAIKILESGYYRVNLRGNMSLTPGVLAARVMCVATVPSPNFALNDCKFGSNDGFNNHGAFPREMVVNYGGSSIVYLTVNTYVYTAGRISTNVGVVGAETDGTVTVLKSNVLGGGTDSRGHTLEVSRFSY